MTLLTTDQLAEIIAREYPDASPRDLTLLALGCKIGIRAVIEALAEAAEAEPFMDFTGNWERSSSEGFADWLREKGLGA